MYNQKITYESLGSVFKHQFYPTSRDISYQLEVAWILNGMSRNMSDCIVCLPRKHSTLVSVIIEAFGARSRYRRRG